jgi:hypothetical protein
MKKFLKILSNILLVLNPLYGFLFFACLVSGYWYYSPLFILTIILTLKFYFYTHRLDYIKYLRWRVEFSKTHEYLGVSPYYEDEVWRNKLTGEIIEI